MSNIHGGWIKLYRSLQDKVYFRKDSEKVHLWILLLLKASYSQNREEYLGGKLYKCAPGEFTAGRRQLALETGLSESKVERCLTYFEKIEQQIEQQKTTRNRLIRIKKWHLYQECEQQIGQQVNNKRTTNEQQVNTLKERKKVKSKEKKNIKKKRFYGDESNEMKLSHLLFDLILKRNPNQKRPDFYEWSETVNKMIRLDGLDPLKIKLVILWCQKDTFWKNNILSTKKLRKHFDALYLKMNEENKKDNWKNVGRPKN